MILFALSRNAEEKMRLSRHQPTVMCLSVPSFILPCCCTAAA